MSFFDKLVAIFGAKKIDVGPFPPCAQASTITQLCEEKKFSTLFELYENASEIDRHLISVNFYHLVTPKVYEQLKKGKDKHPMARYFLAYYLTEAMAQQRGGQRANHVSEDSWDAVFRLAEEASNELDELLKSHENPQIYFALIQIFTVTSEGRKYVCECIEKAIAMTNSHYPIYAQGLNYMTKKWGGSYEDMFAFARKHAKSNENSSANHALIPMAHIERWLGFSMDDEGEKDQHYFDDETIKKELAQHYQQLIEQWRDDVFYKIAGNHFALALYLADLDDELKDCLTRIQGCYVQRPWCYMNADVGKIITDIYSYADMRP